MTMDAGQYFGFTNTKQNLKKRVCHTEESSTSQSSNKLTAFQVWISRKMPGNSFLGSSMETLLAQ